MFTAVLALTMGAPASPPVFVVENKCPCQFAVTNKIVPAKMPATKAGCVCGADCKCVDGTCPGSCPVQAAPVVQYQWVEQRIGPFRSRWVLQPVQQGAPVQAGACVNGTCTGFK